MGFTALGSIFNYPDVLDEPAGEVLADFRDNQGAVSGWFSVLALSAALLAPIAIGVGRLSSQRAMRIAVPVGIAAAVVQVIGLLRWPILVPGYASDAASSNAGVAAAARDSFTTASDILGTALGETLGYLLTATWTVLVIVALGRRYAGRWFQVLGAVSAVLVLAGVLSPLGLPVIDTANFFGYVLWSVWLIAFAVVILVHERRRATAPPPHEPGRGDGMTARDDRARGSGAPCAGCRRSSASRSAASSPSSSPARSTGSPRRCSAARSPASSSARSSRGAWARTVRRPASGSPQPTAGLTVGLALGSAAVGYGTEPRRPRGPGRDLRPGDRDRPGARPARARRVPRGLRR